MSVNRPTLRPTLAAAFAGHLWGANASAGELVVSAAASLTNAFRTWPPPMKRACRHQGGPELRRLRRAAAADRQGAPADVFASADQKAMDKAVEEKAVKPASRVDFAANQVVLIVPTDSRANITALKDLTRDDVKRIAYGNPASVPVGRYAGRVAGRRPVGRRAGQERAGAERAPEPGLCVARRGRRRLRVRHRRRHHGGQGQGRRARAVEDARHLSHRRDRARSRRRKPRASSPTCFRPPARRYCRATASRSPDSA